MKGLVTENYKLDMVSVRLVPDAPVYSHEPIISPKTAISVIGDELRSMDREVFCVINLKTDGTPINCSMISMGTLNMSLAHPREIIKAACLSNTANMLLIHNHPSGKVLPSSDDIAVTKRMVEIGKLIGISVVDHVIVGYGNEYFSFLESTDIIDIQSNVMSNVAVSAYKSDYNNTIPFPGSTR